MVRHTEEFRKQVVNNTARTTIMVVIIEGNTFSSDKYTSLHNVPIYNNGEPQCLIERGRPFGGMMDGDGKLWLCFQRIEGHAESFVELRPLIIDDNDGRLYCNLCYSTVHVDSNELNIRDGSREEILFKCHDYFVAVGIGIRWDNEVDGDENRHDHEKEYKYAILCRSWKTRLKSGEFGIIKPDEDILLLQN